MLQKLTKSDDFQRVALRLIIYGLGKRKFTTSPSYRSFSFHSANCNCLRLAAGTFPFMVPIEAMQLCVQAICAVIFSIATNNIYSEHAFPKLPRVAYLRHSFLIGFHMFAQLKSWRFVIEAKFTYIFHKIMENIKIINLTWVIVRKSSVKHAT